MVALSLKVKFQEGISYLMIKLTKTKNLVLVFAVGLGCFEKAPFKAYCI